MIDAIRAHYRHIRRRVYEEATLPIQGSPYTHARNQETFKNITLSLSIAANLDLYQQTSTAAQNALWRHLWTKNRYAGIRARTATTEINEIGHIFDDWAEFSQPEWDLQSHGHTVLNAGSAVHEFLDRTGRFANLQTIGNVPKLQKLIHVARDFKRFFDAYDVPAIEFVTRGAHVTEVWPIHQGLMERGYRADLTALHFMMDIGFPVIKPEVILSRLFLSWGWLHYAAPDLPMNLTLADLESQGKYRGRYLYTHPRIYRPIIDLSREIVAGLNTDDLHNDIGWVTGNPLREFDFFLVKSGQMPEPKAGLERRLIVPEKRTHHPSNTVGPESSDQTTQQSLRSAI